MEAWAEIGTAAAAIYFIADNVVVWLYFGCGCVLGVAVWVCTCGGVIETHSLWIVHAIICNGSCCSHDYISLLDSAYHCGYDELQS